MAALPQQESPTIAAIYRTYTEAEEKAEPRAHLGASIIGSECARQLWYGFRWCEWPHFSGRMLRLFETGQREEARVVDNLRAVGTTVHDVDPNTSDQFRFATHGGHFGGSLDGVVLGVLEAPKTWHLLEIKTHNARSFAEVKRHGVQHAKPLHFHQMHTYMGMADLTRALYFAVNKNTDEIYVERLRYVPAIHKVNLNKALRVIKAPEPLTKIANSAQTFACKRCDFREVCHGDTIPPVSCRTCVHSTPITDRDGGRWRCNRHDNDLSKEQQLRGCDEHLYIPALIPYAEPIDAGEDWVAYRVRGADRYFINCARSGFPAIDAPHYSSKGLVAVSPPSVDLAWTGPRG